MKHKLTICIAFALSLSLPGLAQKGKGNSGQAANDNKGNGQSAKNLVADTTEYSVLTQLYNITGGAGWLRNQHWGSGTTAKDMQRWQGINFSQGDVHQLNMEANNMAGNLPTRLGELSQLKHIKLNQNQLGGAVPYSLSQLSELQTLELQNNRFTSFPNFSLNANKVNLKVNVSNNNLDFGDLEPNFSAPGQPIFKEFVYANQGLLGAPDSLYQRERTRLLLSLQTGGTHNQYQWQKQTNGQWQNVSGATATTLEFFPLQLANSGQYRCKVTNTRVPGLTLYTHNYTVQVEEYAEVPFVVDGTQFPAGMAYHLQADTIDVVRELNTLQEFILINPIDTVKALLSLEGADGKALSGGYSFKIDPLGNISELLYVSGTGSQPIHSSLYAIDSNQLQLFPLPEARSLVSPYQLNLQQGLVYKAKNNVGEANALQVSGIPADATNYQFSVYNGTGDAVFVSQDPKQAWFGKLTDGTQAQPGVYRYLLEVNNQSIRGQFLLK